MNMINKHKLIYKLTYNHFIELNMISENRLEIMGLAIILIMCFHSSICPFGFIGVEIFLSISAMGLYFALKKNNDIKRYYKRRLVRILPAYFITSIYFFFSSYYNDPNRFYEIIKNIFQVNTIIGASRYQWFIAEILICYLITPFILRYKKIFFSNFFLLFFIFICFSYGKYILPSIMIQRFPIFMTSLKISQYVYKKKTINFNLHFTLFIVICTCTYFTIEGYLNLPTPYDYFLAFCITYPFIIILLKLINCLNMFFRNILRFLGSITLELYLVHELICLPLIHQLIPNTISIINCALSIIFAILLAYFLHKFVKFIIKTENQSSK